MPIEPGFETADGILEDRRCINVSLIDGRELGAEGSELWMPRGAHEALELINDLQGRCANHHCPKLDDLHVLTRDRSCIATSGFEVYD